MPVRLETDALLRVSDDAGRIVRSEPLPAGTDLRERLRLAHENYARQGWTLNVQESFSPFGQRRQSNWAAGVPIYWDQVAIAESTRHGFTGHEHLDNVGLIHMNGRVYDPITGRFLSTDPVIGDLTDSQRLNPYCYVSNRPLTATDPTGFDELQRATGTQGILPPGWYFEAAAYCLAGCEYEFANGTADVKISSASAQQINGVPVNSGAGAMAGPVAAGAGITVSPAAGIQR
jgi:RHS repeat-associated protein